MFSTDITPERANRLIAAVATLIVALALLMCLLVIPVKEPARLSPKESTAHEMALLETPEPEEFIEPVLLQEQAGDNADNADPAPAPQGEPEQAAKPSDKKVVSSTNPTPNPSQEKLVTTPSPSTKKTADPQPAKEPESKIASNMKGQFSPHNGTPQGSSTPSASSGSAPAGSGSGATGTLKGGRSLLSCPMPSVTLRQKVVIKVEVYVAADGHVTEANVISGSSDATLREKCRQASLRARWTPKADAPRTRGVITWTLVPKI